MGHDGRADPCGGGKNSFGYLNLDDAGRASDVRNPRIEPLAPAQPPACTLKTPP